MGSDGTFVCRHNGYQLCSTISTVSCFPYAHQLHIKHAILYDESPEQWFEDIGFKDQEVYRDTTKPLMEDYTPLTAHIKCPVLVMTGDQDYAIGPEHYLSFHFPKQTVVHYIGGHAPFQEEPQWFAEKIINFSGEK
jgi:pimeloyl-ACP methyl ester carboxylesterase